MEGIVSKEDVLELWATDKTRAQDREMAAIHKDIQKATEYILDALARYRKTKTRAKSKKAATENPFAELEGYESREQIQDDYGWEFITEARMDRLLELWDLREQGGGKGDGLYRDRVTEMLEKAAATVGAEYAEQLAEYAMEKRKREQEAETIARENNQRTWARKYREV